MAIYAIEIILLVLLITEFVSSTPDNTRNMVPNADNFTAGGKIKELNHCLKTIRDLGPKFSYYPEATKLWLIVKKELCEDAVTMFIGTKIKITSGRREAPRSGYWIKILYRRLNK